MANPDPNDYQNYPESALRDRIKLAYDWIPQNSRQVLDGGCAFGYGTRHFRKDGAKVSGIDPNYNFITLARQRYPDIAFEVCGLERTPFAAESFDVVILNDVLEHVINERQALDEMCRLLSPGGVFIITTPHCGLFSFMDPDNYTYHLRTKAPWLYRFLFRAKYGQLPPTEVKPGYDQLHRHYTLADFKRLLDNSAFKGQYEIDKVFRGGLFIGVFAANLYELLSIFLGMKKARACTRWMEWLSDHDYFVPYGPLAYNIGIRVKKAKPSR